MASSVSIKLTKMYRKIQWWNSMYFRVDDVIYVEIKFFDFHNFLKNDQNARKLWNVFCQ